MNMTNVLLGTTSLLLVVGLALNFGGFHNDRQDDSSKEEIAKLKEEIQKFDAEERAQELARLRASRPILPPIAASIPAPAPMPLAPANPETTAISEDLQRVIDAQNDKIKTLEDEKEELALAKDAIEAETEDINEEKNKRRSEQSMAAFRIKNALAMGTVTTATKENGLVIFTPSPSANFQPGKILAVRRNSGIIGHIEIDRLDETGDYVATMRPHGYSPDGYPDIQPGDTVIINLEG
jgi:septal ring factor EnvC (AmiA/AmiB activator)